MVIDAAPPPVLVQAASEAEVAQAADPQLSFEWAMVVAASPMSDPRGTNDANSSVLRPDGGTTEQTEQPASGTGAVARVLARAMNWAAQVSHPVVSVDHLLFALSMRVDGGAQAMADAGVRDVQQLEDKLLHVVYGAPSAPSLGKPQVDDAVYAVVHHAQGFGRQQGRNETQLEDVLEAVCFLVTSGAIETAGAKALREHWPRVAPVDPTLSRLEQIRSQQIELTQVVLGRIAGLAQALQSTETHVVQLEGQLADARAQIAMLEGAMTKKPAGLLSGLRRN
ncbi:MAG: hypothetical protein KF779_15695 [Hyphomonadaceae bacterium]|nr:hypothetical protein [Hyphomonadaceae bacterium]